MSEVGNKDNTSPSKTTGKKNGPVKHLVLVVDDIPDNVTMLTAHLRARGYNTVSAKDGQEALMVVSENPPDLIMMDINMPVMNGLDACKQLKLQPETKPIPIILVTANSNVDDIVRGFEVGADDYLIKPYNFMEMLARVRSMLRIWDAQQELIKVNRELDELNSDLEEKVMKQVLELERVNRLRRFFSPQLVNTITSENSDEILGEHRREITVVFLDLRNFTSFSIKAEPQEVIHTIRELHEVVGPIIFRYRGTLERFTGDGLMVFLGDPEPMEDHPVQAVKMGIEIRDEVETLRSTWAEKGYDLALGIGIGTGEASLGTIGFEGRLDYAAIGVVTNLSARICSMANGGQILISEETHEQIKDSFETVPCGKVEFKGFSKPQPVYEVV
jgi:adenylate cyclase